VWAAATYEESKAVALFNEANPGERQKDRDRGRGRDRETDVIVLRGVKGCCPLH
jgi:hypothetical protein